VGLHFAVGQREIFLRSRIRENLDSVRDDAPNLHESGYSQHAPLRVQKTPADTIRASVPEDSIL